MADAQPLDDATLEELERVAAAMTEGPWHHELLGPGKLRYRITNPKGDAELGNWLVGEVRWGVNATGIALLRNHASALLHSSREAARLRTELEEARRDAFRNAAKVLEVQAREAARQEEILAKLKSLEAQCAALSPSPLEE
jgi:hypothetical protein